MFHSYFERKNDKVLIFNIVHFHNFEIGAPFNWRRPLRSPKLNSLKNQLAPGVIIIAQLIRLILLYEKTFLRMPDSIWKILFLTIITFVNIRKMSYFRKVQQNVCAIDLLMILGLCKLLMKYQVLGNFLPVINSSINTISRRNLTSHSQLNWLNMLVEVTMLL